MAVIMVGAAGGGVLAVPHPPFRHDVSAALGVHGEAAVVAVPGMPRRLVAAAVNIDLKTMQHDLFVSDDGGATFVRRILSDQATTREGVETLYANSDPSLVADRAGNIWYSIIGSDFVTMEDRILVDRIPAGTTTPETPTVGLDAPIETALQDKPFLAIDNSTASPTFGRLYASWDQVDDETPGQVSLSLLISQCDTRVDGRPDAAHCDDPRSWSPPVTIATGGAFSSRPAIGPDGEIYEVWWDFSKRNAIVGTTCDSSASDCATGAGWSGRRKVIARLNSFGGVPVGLACATPEEPNGLTRPSPAVATDVSRGPNRGRVYVTWGDLRSGTGTTRCATDSQGNPTPPRSDQLAWRAYIASSRDALPGRAAPSAAVATSLLPRGRGSKARRDDWYPWPAVDETNGHAWAFFYSTRGDPRRHAANYYVRAVLPYRHKLVLGRLTRASSVASNYSGDPCCIQDLAHFEYGDYDGGDATSGYVFPAWTQGRTGEPPSLYVGVLRPPLPGCVVPNVVGKTLSAARRSISRVLCRTGRIARVRSRLEAKRVVAQKPRAGLRAKAGTRVSLRVSRGPKWTQRCSKLIVHQGSRRLSRQCPAKT